MPPVGVEPTLPCGNWILSPARLPIPPQRHEVNYEMATKDSKKTYASRQEKLHRGRQSLSRWINDISPA